MTRHAPRGRDCGLQSVKPKLGHAVRPPETALRSPAEQDRRCCGRPTGRQQQPAWQISSGDAHGAATL